MDERVFDPAPDQWPGICCDPIRQDTRTAIMAKITITLAAMDTRMETETEMEMDHFMDRAVRGP